MDQTPRLALPFIMPQQAQKHITHNEALQALDILVQPTVESRTTAVPPVSPLLGEAYVVPQGATGVWAGHAQEIVSYQAGAWLFLDPSPGWQVYIKAERTPYVFDGNGWVPLMGSGLPQLGINASADAINRLAVSADASLFSHDGQGHQLKLNKASAGDTASLLYQSNWTGHAEMGLMGDNTWRLKVSADGAAWLDAITVEPDLGTTTVAGTLRPAIDNSVTLGQSGARWASAWLVTGVIQTSDARQKTDIADSDLGLDFILGLRPVRYRWQSGAATADSSRPGRRTHYGLIAQEVKAQLDALEHGDFAGHVLANPADPHSEAGLRYDAFIAPLIAAIQQLAARVAALEAVKS